MSVARFRRRRSLGREDADQRSEDGVSEFRRSEVGGQKAGEQGRKMKRVTEAGGWRPERQESRNDFFCFWLPKLRNSETPQAQVGGSKTAAFPETVIRSFFHAFSEMPTKSRE
jgi:hypothetical protein